MLLSLSPTMLNNYLFPFNDVSDEDLLHVINSSEVFRQEVHESLDPLSVEDDKYNNDLDVNQFYLRSRHVNFPKSEYTFLASFSSLCTESHLKLFSMNIRSISTNFQYFKDTVLSDSLTYDVFGFTETQVFHHCILCQHMRC